MLRIMLAFLVAISAAAAAPAAFASIAAAAGQPGHIDVVAATRKAMALGVQQVRDDDLAGAKATLASAIQSEGFPQLQQDEQFQALALGSFTANASSDHRAAFEWSMRACALPAARDNPDIWHERLSAAYDLNDYADSARSLTTIAQRWPETLEKINETAIHNVAGRLADDAAMAKDRFELLRSLFNAKWLSDGEEPAWLWVDLARNFLDRRDTRSATAILARIYMPTAVVAMRVDKRFDKLRRADPQAFDVKQASVSSIAHAQERVSANPKRLQPLVQLQYLLRKAQQPERALRIADEIIAKSAHGHGNEIYADFGDYYRWILDLRADSLWQLGRWDEAVTQQRHAARYPEHGELNVSQALNLSAFYAKLGRVDDALDATSDLGAMSLYGRMQLEAIGVIDAVQRGNAVELEAHLDYMRLHRSDALVSYQDALLDADRLDEASNLLIERLRSVALRTDALAEVQIYVDDTPMTPLVQTREARRRAVINTKPVQKALAKVGRIENVSLASPLH